MKNELFAELMESIGQAWITLVESVNCARPCCLRHLRQ